MYAKHQHLSDAWLGHCWSANDFWRSMLRAWLHCGNKSQLLSFSQKRTQILKTETCRKTRLWHLTIQESPWHIGASQHVAPYGAEGERDQAKTLYVCNIESYMLCLSKGCDFVIFPSFSGFSCWLDSWWTCSVFVKTGMQAFVLPKLYTCNRGISMQRDASQEDLMWKMTSKKTKRPPVKPFHSPIPGGVQQSPWKMQTNESHCEFVIPSVILCSWHSAESKAS